MQQTSAQGIASLFRGNPEPLQQRIQQEQQARPGLPPDLQKLLALNIVTNEKDAAAKQQAMDQLAQMQGGSQGQQGQMPTVMQTVQEQARQKMQAQAVQAQQQQQGLQALMQQVQSPQAPENLPQPEPQPQGIDELPVEFQMAGGGIVAFEEGGKTDKYETPYDRMNRKNRGELTEDERREAEAREALLAQIPTDGMPTVTGGERARGSELERNILNTLAALPGAGSAKATTLGRQSLAGLAALLGSDKSNTQEDRAEQRTIATPAAPISRPTSQMTPQQMEAAMRSTPTEKPVADLKALAEQQQRQQAPRPARVPMAAPVAPAAAATPMAAPQVAMPPQESEADLIQKAAMLKDPEAERIKAAKRRLEAIGAPDTSAQDRMIAELEKRKAQLEGPQDSFGRLMEYLGQVAATPRGLSSFEAGAQGASGVRKLEQTRQLEQYNLTKQALDVSQKKLDTVRAFATDQYNVGENRFNQVYKEQFDAAKQVSNNEQEARKLAQQNTLKMLELEQSATIDRERMQNQLKVANIGQTREYNEQARINKITSLKQQARRATDPKVAAELMAQATDLEMAVGRGGAGAAAAAGPKLMTRDQAEDNVRKDLEDFRVGPKLMSDATAALKASGIANPTTLQIKEYLVQQNMKGVDLAAPAQTGKVPPPPPGFKLN